VADSDSKIDTNVTPVPEAVVDSNRVGIRDIFTGSYMWLVALLCLLVAIGIVWWSSPDQGIQISIHFPEGHGLRAEDSVRFRGIDVGAVEEVKLNQELNGVDVTVNLLPFAEPLARKGSRFWIVRPELSLGGVSGLETAVGHKYIGLIPGAADGEWQDQFKGLTESPPDAIENEGVEVILRGDNRLSVSSGSPVTFRGVEIGRVLSVGLSQDGRHVDARIKIFEAFRKLVTSKSRFWAASGVDVEVSLTSGMKLNTESLETLVRGGISMLTIENGGQPVNPGQVFTLYAKQDEDWPAQAQNFQATDVVLRGAIPMEAVWKQKGLLGTSEKRASFVGAAFSEGGITIPADVLTPPSRAIDGSLQIGIAGRTDLRLPAAELGGEPSQKTVSVSISDVFIQFPKLAPFQASEIRASLVPERCLAVRSVGESSNGGEMTGLTFFHYTIEAEEIADPEGDNHVWKLTHFNGDRSVWHGAPVLAARDGSLIGVLLVGEKEAEIEIVK
jgi:hypothetical protein